MSYRTAVILALGICLGTAPAVHAATVYGDADVLGTGTYASDPKAGATLQGLAPNVVTLATLITPHGFPFDPVSDYPGTDQIFVGSSQTANHDGYSSHANRLNGPQVISLDYSAIVPVGHAIDTLTLGIAADDFQFNPFGQPFVAMLNSLAAPTLTAQLNAFNQTGPRVQFFTIGVDPAILAPNHVLTLSIDEGGDGGDGWAVDFLTVDVTTSPMIPLPSGIWLGVGLLSAMANVRSPRDRQR